MRKSFDLHRWHICILMLSLCPFSSAWGNEDADEISKKLSNPLAEMISLPFQFNYDHGIGPAGDGEKFTLNVQPVMPFQLNEDWNVISRTIVPFIWQDEVLPGENTDFGMGDITQSFFFSPKSSSSLIWGIGPVLYLPTATEETLGAEKWGLGPTGILVNQTEKWTVGLLANHIWDVAGDDDRNDISLTMVQPFLAYHAPEAWTYTLQSETTYDWEANDASVPINFLLSKVVHFGRLPVSLQGGVGYWVDSPEDTGPEEWRIRTAITFVLPK